MTKIIGERRFADPISEADLSAFAARQQDCLDIQRVTYLRSLLSQDRRRMICEYDAPDTESVRRVQHRAEGPFETIRVAAVL